MEMFFFSSTIISEILEVHNESVIEMIQENDSCFDDSSDSTEVRLSLFENSLLETGQISSMEKDRTRANVCDAMITLLEQKRERLPWNAEESQKRCSWENQTYRQSSCSRTDETQSALSSSNAALENRICLHTHPGILGIFAFMSLHCTQ